MNPSFESSYADLQVLVTGHTGVKGAWLAAWLQRLGARVTGFALPPEHGARSLFEAARIGDGMTSVLGDLRDLRQIREVCRQHRPAVVFHLAAQSLVRRGHRDPIETYATNVIGTVHLLDALRAAPGVRAVVVVTSDKCYRERGPGPGFRESDELGGHDPYSSSKACAELVVRAYRSSFLAQRGVAVASARAGNVICGGDWAEDRLVPDLVRGVLAGQPTVVRNPAAVRPWQHVLDPLAGYLLLGARLLEGDGNSPWAEAWNFGPPDGDAMAVRDLVGRVTDLWDAVRMTPAEGDDGPVETGFLQLDAAKARDRLGWSPRLTTGEAIRWTVDWYRGFLDDPRTAPAMLARQLAAYTERLEAP